LFVFSCLIMYPWAMYLHAGFHARPDFTSQPQRVVMLAMSLFYLLIYLLHMVSGMLASVVRERQLGTLDGLLLLPIARRAILHAKLKAYLSRGRAWLLAFLLAWLVVMLSGAFPGDVGLLQLGVIFAHLAFFAALAIYLSAVSR